MKYTGMLCLLPKCRQNWNAKRAKRSVRYMARLNHCGRSLTDKIMSRKPWMNVCLSEGYKSCVCISLSKDVNTEIKKSIIWLLFCVGVTGSVWHWQKNIQDVHEILGQISRMSSSKKTKKKYMFENRLWGKAAKFPWTQSFNMFIRGDT